MKIKFMFSVLFALELTACKSQTNNSTDQNIKNTNKLQMNVEKFPFDMYKKCDYSGTYTDKQGTEFELFFDEESGGSSIEKRPLPNFFRTYKEYFKNGNIKFVKTLLSKVLIGKSKYYDQDGHFIKEVDEDLQHAPTGPNEILNFLQQNKHLDLKTGKGWDNITITFDEDKKQWTIQIVTGKEWLGGVIIDDNYIIDTKTGKLVDHIGEPIRH